MASADFSRVPPLEEAMGFDPNNQVQDDPSGYVLDALSAERDYQRKKWGDTDAFNNVGDFILYMERELEKARAAYIAPNAPVEAAMAGIRKVATLGVAAMEKFGTGTPR